MNSNRRRGAALLFALLAGAGLAVAACGGGADSPAVIAPAAESVRGQQTNGYVIVPKNSPIKSGKEVTGKTFAVDQIGGLPYASCRAWVDATGGDSKAVKFIELAFSEMMPAIQSGRLAISPHNARTHIAIAGSAAS